MYETSNPSALGDTIAERSTDGEAPVVGSVRGQSFGRYLLLDKLGAGAMGIVYAAYDPELDRKLAIKLLESRGNDVEASQQRLAREAQALAKLGHPNVVTVHDVGVHRGQVFIAMEFVDGQTLGSWQEQARESSGTRKSSSGRLGSISRRPTIEARAVRPWPEVLEVFMQAGRGLAAAHEAGLIHRDFKPDNVMLGNDGRVRVMDFGLARIAEHGAVELGDAVAAPVARLTQTGALLGTPRYMALEQFAGGQVDARSDQFGFCVALYESLYGERPFAAATIGELILALEGEAIAAAPRGTAVPSWVRAVVLRGLAADPAARFESMDALLDALAADPAARLRRRAIRSGLALGLAAGVWGLVSLSLDLAERDVVIDEQADELARQNTALEQQLAAQTRMLSVQRGLRAKALIPESRESEALILAIEAVGAYVPSWTGIPREAIEALEQVLAHDTILLTHDRVLRGHDDFLTNVEYSPDGSRIATTSFDGTGRIWTLGPNPRSVTLTGAEGRLFEVEFAPDGSRLATVGDDGRARIWDPTTGAALATCVGHTDWIVDHEFAPDGAGLATASLDGTARVWDVATCTSRFTLEGDGASELKAIAYAPDGARIATAGTDARARIWDAATGTLLATLDGHEGPILDLAFSPDGTRLATASEDGDARIWAVETGAPVATLDGVSLRVHRLAFSPDGARLVTAGFDTVPRVFEVETGALVHALESGHGSGVTEVVFALDGSRIATAGYDGSVALWDAKTGALRARLIGHTHDVWSLGFAPNGRELATAGVDRTLRVWELGYVEVAAREGPEASARRVAYSPDWSRMLSWEPSGGGAQLWDVARGERLASFGMAAWGYSADGTRIVTFADGELRVWDGVTGEPIRRHPGVGSFDSMSVSPNGAQVGLWNSRGEDGARPATVISLAGGEALEFDGRGTIGSVVFSPDGERFVIASSGAGVEVFANDGRPLETRALCRPGAAKHATWSADGSRLAAIGDDHSVAIWTASSAGPPICLAHQDKVTGVVFSPDATALATWTRFATVRIWRSDDGRPLAELEPDGQDSQTVAVTFSPDGRHLAIVHERTVELRSAQTYERTAILEGHSASVPNAHFSPDGARLTTIDRKDGAKLWDVETGELLGHERIGVVGSDGSIAWPAAPDELLRIACERLRMHDRESLDRYAQARAICDSLRAR